VDRVGAEVGRELARFGPDSGLAPLVETWARAVGPDVSRNAWPARLARDGTLHVHTSSSTWAFELGQLEQRVREALGDLAPRRLRFTVGALPEPSAETVREGGRQPVEPSAEQRARARELSAPIEDENLRKVVAKAAAASLAEAESGRSFW
jgi:hypothetical protein